MDALELARELIAYEGWANRRVLETAMALDTNPSSDGASWKNLDRTLQHLVGSQATWLGRWMGEPPIERDAGDRTALVSWFAEVQAALETFAAGLSPERYLADIEFRDSRGNPHRDSLAVLIAHLVNHGTAHRSEVAVLLTEAGHSPGDLDMIVYRRLMAPGR